MTESNSTPESEEVEKERRIREIALQHEEDAKAQQQSIVEAEEKHQEAQRAEHNARVDAAEKFDWQAWEDETGLTRPEIPPRL